MFRGIYNILVVFSFMLAVFLHGLALDLLVKNELRRLNRKIDFLHKVAKLGTKLIGIRIKEVGGDHNRKASFIVSNHLSYLDIIIISSLYRSVFVSTTEVGSSKFFGKLASYGGAIFIDRTKRTALKEDIQKVKDVIEKDTNVAIFLEGTTSNGDGVLPFKSSFLEVVFKTGKPVFGLCLKYTAFNSKPVDQEVREFIYYYGDHVLLPHVLRFLYHLKSLEVEVKEVGFFSPENYQSRKELATELYNRISTVYAS
ncbi:MAG: 1-acyl-sn-glycerol-3-phosphate acyltransferase [Hydrogenothermaceae bacterium]|nr:1-acyl-sn-glycerol-3-phosphate acyltransferase [Hydrogenothermaceae bacterium]